MVWSPYTRPRLLLSTARLRLTTSWLYTTPPIETDTESLEVRALPRRRRHGSHDEKFESRRIPSTAFPVEPSWFSVERPLLIDFPTTRLPR
ncbi:hypothetical protein F5Y05DRAFT_374678 [Hypoxylon sp. FL0543]|nr:hypothetical protein F5Y05DRAFT_374678 [Hypoxylon sp. FL0543]